MSAAGEESEFVNASRVRFTNATLGNFYKQIYNVSVFINAINTTLRQLSNDTLEKLYDLRDFAIEGDIMVTEPEITTWVGLTVQTNNNPTAQSYQVAFTDENGNTTTLSGTFRLTQLNHNRVEEGAANYHIRLESIDGDVLVT